MNIYVRGWIHPKNYLGMEMMSGKGINFFYSEQPNINFDYLMLTDSFSLDNRSQDQRIIFGPHISLERLGEYPKNFKSRFNSLSPWLADLSNKLFPGNNYICLPFPIDTEKFSPREKIGDPVIYFKRRDPELLSFFIGENRDTNFKIYDYERGYNGEEFLRSISEAPYAVWIGCHESQGFALGETLSCNTPIFVIDAKTLKDEIGAGWGNRFPGEELTCTSASYFDDRCGLKSNVNRFREDFTTFLNRIKIFNPRQFILETLSVDACIKKWKDALIDE